VDREKGGEKLTQEKVDGLMDMVGRSLGESASEAASPDSGLETPPPRLWRRGAARDRTSLAWPFHRAGARCDAGSLKPRYRTPSTRKPATNVRGSPGRRPAGRRATL